MPDIQDLVIKAIQDYGFSMPKEEVSEPARSVILAYAERIAPHVINYLKLEQEWAVGTFFSGRLDSISNEDTDPSVVMDDLELWERLDAQEIAAGNMTPAIRRALMTNLRTPWTEEDDPEVDEHLMELVANDGDPCPTPDLCEWREYGDDGSLMRCRECHKIESVKTSSSVVQ